MSSQDFGHTHGTMANPQEHLSGSSSPHLPLSENKTFNGLQDDITPMGSQPSPKLLKDQQEKGVVQTELPEGMNSPITTTVLTSISEDSRDQFENSVLQLREQDESEMAVSHRNSNTMDGEGTSGTEDIKIQFSRSGSGSGGFLEGLFGCLRPVWNIIGKAYSTDYKLQQQGKLEYGLGRYYLCKHTTTVNQITLTFRSIKKTSPRGSCYGSVLTNLTSIHEDVGSIPDPAQWVKDPALPQAAA